MTIFMKVEPIYKPDDPIIQEAGRLIREGLQVAFPTETVYGLGADARSTEAVDGIFQAKGRPSDNPLIVHIAEHAQLDELAEQVDKVSRLLSEAFWPGPLTLVLPVRAGAVSPRVTAGLNTVAVRMPNHPVALSLIVASGCPLAAPSANRSGRPSPTLAEHVQDDLNGRIAAIVDGGAAGVGVESTVVEVADGRIHILRPGGITAEELERAGGLPVEESYLAAGQKHEPSIERKTDKEAGMLQDKQEQAQEEAFRPKAPGMKYTHYAPQGRMIVIRGEANDAEAVCSRVQRELDEAAASGERTGALVPREHAERIRADIVVPWGSLRDPELAARELFAALRRFDDEKVTFIAAEAILEQGIGAAVMNRLYKAAGNRVVQV